MTGKEINETQMFYLFPDIYEEKNRKEYSSEEEFE
jgi:hypothetical protein